MNTEKYMPAELPQKDLFVKMNFSERQLIAMRKLFYKYFSHVTDNFQYIGNAITIVWDPANNSPLGKFNDSFKPTEATMGYQLNRTIHLDPLWQEFKDILPYMGMNATITCMPPYSVMTPHVDRPGRTQAIYFPISGCTYECNSDCYRLPKYKDPNMRNWTHEPVIPIHTYHVVDNAYLMNAQEWHGVRNYSKETRIAIGWNFINNTGMENKSYFEMRDIFTKLGYIKE
jgi:hypothetical protein